MSGPLQTQDRRVLLCRCGHADVIPAGVRRRVLDHLAEAGLAVDVVDDLCGLAARGDELLQQLADAPALCVVACHTRAVRWLLRQAGVEVDDGRVTLLDMRGGQVEEIIAALPPAATPAAGDVTDHGEADDGWIPWFPVIDYDRCVDCEKCLGFCLFGVYASGPDGRVEVAEPANCKTNCPACARVCPTAAIIFPKYKAAPFNGAEVTDADAAREPAKVDVAKLVDQDVHAALRRRSAARFAPSADAELTRQNRLRELQEELDIPDDVIRSLSPPGRPDNSDAPAR